jgi:exodeoxyribonuclease VII small subunit
MAKRKTKPAEQPITDDDGNPLKFDDAVGQLERIIRGIESGQIGLEQALEEYEKGSKLIAHCKQILDRAEEKIKELKVEDDASAAAAAADGADDQ